MNTGNAPPIFTVCGQNHHRIGSLLPVDGSTPRFGQLYIYDTENEIQNKINSVSGDSSRNDLDTEIIRDIRTVLDQFNVLVKTFRRVRDNLLMNENTKVRLRLLANRSTDARMYNLPTANEVAALIIGDFNGALEKREIIIETKSGLLQRINELHPSYLLLQYPLFFPYGEDGYKDIKYSERWRIQAGGRNRVSLREYSAYRLHERRGQESIHLYGKRLTEQIIVDLFTMVESGRFQFIRDNQNQLRSDLYNGLQDALITGESDASKIGRRVVLPSSFTGGARNMIQNYQRIYIRRFSKVCD